MGKCKITGSGRVRDNQNICRTPKAMRYTVWDCYQKLIKRYKNKAKCGAVCILWTVSTMRKP